MATATKQAKELWRRFSLRRLLGTGAALTQEICAFYQEHFPHDEGAGVAMRFIAAKTRFEELCVIHLRNYGVHPDLMDAARELDAAQTAVHQLHGNIVVTVQQTMSAAAFCEARAALHAEYGLFITHTGCRPFPAATQTH